MDEFVKTEEGTPLGNDPEGIELWKSLGRREAFGLVAARCSAAEVESLRRIRDTKLYQKLNCTWEEFCERQLHVSCRTIQREIAALQRFGPAYFTLRQLTRVSSREYALIAPQVSEEGVHVDGAVVPLLPEHSEALAGAVETLVRRRETAAAVPAPVDAFETVLKKFRAATQDLSSLAPTIDARQAHALARELAALLSAAAACGVTIGVQ